MARYETHEVEEWWETFDWNLDIPLNEPHKSREAIRISDNLKAWDGPVQDLRNREAMRNADVSKPCEGPEQDFKNQRTKHNLRRIEGLSWSCTRLTKYKSVEKLSWLKPCDGPLRESRK